MLTLCNIHKEYYISATKTMLMKKTFLSIVAVAAFATGVNAQTKFGPELGLNMAKETQSGYTTSFRAGARIGGIVDIGMGDHFALQPGIFYTMMGTNGKDALTNSDANVKLNYIYVPIDLLYKFGETESNRFFVGLGPVVGYCLGGSETFAGSSYTIKVGSGSDYYTGYVKAIDFGANVLIGYELSSGLVIKAGYYAGLSDIQANTALTSKTTNSAIQVSLAWLFGGSRY